MKSEVYKAKWDRNFPLDWGPLFSVWVSARHVLASLASVWALLEVTVPCSVRSSQVFGCQLFVIQQWKEKAPPACPLSACPLSVQPRYIRTIRPFRLQRPWRLGWFFLLYLFSGLYVCEIKAKLLVMPQPKEACLVFQTLNQLVHTYVLRRKSLQI